MRVPSFLTKSGSSTPGICVLVVVYEAGPGVGSPAAAGPLPSPPPRMITPPLSQWICASRRWRISATAASWTAFSTAGQPCTACRATLLTMRAGCPSLELQEAASASVIHGKRRSMDTSVGILPRCDPRLGSEPGGHAQQQHFHDEQDGADSVQRPEPGRGSVTCQTHGVDGRRHQRGGGERAQAGEERQERGARPPELQSADDGHPAQRQCGGIETGEHGPDGVGGGAPARVVARQRGDLRREDTLRGDAGKEELRSEQRGAGNPIQTCHRGLLRYRWRACKATWTSSTRSSTTT